MADQILLWYLVLGGICFLWMAETMIAALRFEFNSQIKERHEKFLDILTFGLDNPIAFWRAVIMIGYILAFFMLLVIPIIGLLAVTIPCNDQLPRTNWIVITCLSMYFLPIMAIHLKRKLCPLKA